MISPHEKLPRLHPQAYRGTVCVHWTMTMDRRARGWLDETLHTALREALVHACVRGKCVCPVYCLMPDHGHFLILGAHAEADSRVWAKMVRTMWSTLLPQGIKLQRQAYDHLLREKDREKDAFAAVAWYILENPVRAGLVKNPEAWPFSGTIFPGYPTLNFRQARFWDVFWSAYSNVLSANHRS